MDNEKMKDFFTKIHEKQESNNFEVDKKVITNSENYVNITGLVLYPNSNEPVPSGDQMIGTAYGSYDLFVYCSVDVAGIIANSGLDMSEINDCIMKFHGNNGIVTQCEIRDINYVYVADSNKSDGAYIVPLSLFKTGETFPNKVYFYLTAPNSYDVDTITSTEINLQIIPKLTGITITSRPNQTGYTEGNTVNTYGMVVTAYYNDGSSKSVKGYNYSPKTPLILSDNAITVTYTENGITKTASTPITVTPKVLTDIIISRTAAKSIYNAGETFDPSGMAVTAFFNNGTFEDIFGFSYPTDSLTAGISFVTISYTYGDVTKTATHSVWVSPSVPSPLQSFPYCCKASPYFNMKTFENNTPSENTNWVFDENSYVIGTVNTPKLLCDLGITEDNIGECNLYLTPHYLYTNMLKIGLSVDGQPIGTYDLTTDDTGNFIYVVPLKDIIKANAKGNFAKVVIYMAENQNPAAHTVISLDASFIVTDFEEASGVPDNVASMTDNSMAASDFGENPKVNLCTGRMLFALSDLSIGANSYEIGAAHTYNSSLIQRYNELRTCMGNGWKLSVQQFVYKDGYNYKYIDSAGYTHIFTLFDIEHNRYNDRCESGLTLRVTASEYTIFDDLGNTMYFDAGGRLIRTVSCHNASIEKHYVYSDDKLTLIYDSRKPSERIVFAYDGNLLSKMSAMKGNEELIALHYYYSHGNLIKISKSVKNMPEKEVSIFAYYSSGYMSAYADAETKAAIEILYTVSGKIKYVNKGFCAFDGEGMISNFTRKTFEKFNFGNSDGFVNKTSIKNEKDIVVEYYQNRIGKITSAFESRTDIKGRKYLKSLKAASGVKSATKGSDGAINGSPIIDPAVKSFGDVNPQRKGEKDIMSYNANMWVKHKKISDGIALKFSFDSNGKKRNYYENIDPDAYDAWQHISIPIALNFNDSDTDNKKAMSNIKLKAYDIDGNSVDILVGDLRVTPCPKSCAFVTNESPSVFSLGTNFDNYNEIAFRFSDDPYNDVVLQLKKPIIVDGETIYVQDKNNKFSMEDLLNTAQRNRFLNNYFLYDFIMNKGKRIITDVGCAELREPTGKNNVPLNLVRGEIKPHFRTLTSDARSETDIKYFVDDDGTRTVTTTKVYMSGGVNPGIAVEKESVTESKSDNNGKIVYERDAYGVLTEYFYDAYGQNTRVKITGTDNKYIERTVTYDSYKEYSVSTYDGVTTENYTYETPFALPKSTSVGNGRSEIIYGNYNDEIVSLKNYENNFEQMSNDITYENGNIRTVSDGGVKYGIRYDLANDITVFGVFDGEIETDIHRREQVFDERTKKTTFKDYYYRGDATDTVTAVADKYGKLQTLSDGEKTITYRYCYSDTSETAVQLSSLYDPYENRTYSCTFDNDGNMAGISTSDGKLIIRQIGGAETRYVIGNEKYKTKVEYEADCVITPRIKKTYVYYDPNNDNDDDWEEVGVACKEYVYDGLGRVAAKLQISDGSAVYNYEYKTDGNKTLPLLSKKTYNSMKQSAPDRFTIEYAYDDRGNTVGVKDTKYSQKENSYNYVRNTVYGYDGINRLSNEFITENGITVSGRSYIYLTAGNGKGRLGQITDRLDSSRTKVFTYDGRGRLINCAAGGVNYEYDYDNYGNVKQKKVDGISRFTCDWERGNLLKKITLGNSVFDYSYNHNNVRFAKTANGTTTNFYLDEDKILGEDRSDGRKLRYYYDADGLCGFGYNKTNYAYVKDGLGNISMITDTSGNILAIYKYDTFGRCEVCDGKGNPNADTTFIGKINPIRWRCYYYDEESGLYYANGRYYDSNICKYIDAAEADTILANAYDTLGLDRNGIASTSVITMAPYSSTIATNSELSIDPNYDPNAGKPWWELHFLEALLNAFQIVIGLVMAVSGNPGGILLMLSGAAGMLGLAYSESIAKAIGLSATGIQALAAGITLLTKCCSPLSVIAGIAGLASGAACLMFAGAEAQESITGNNYMRGVIGDGWYSGLMVASELLATAAVVYNQYGPKCFAAGTLVQTEKGHKKIEEIEVGDRVLAYNEETGEQGYKEVVRLFRNSTLTTHHLSFDSSNEPIVCTPDHPFYILNAKTDTPIVNFEGRDESRFAGQWVQAKYLKVGNKVLLSDGKTAILTKTELEHLSEPITTYNFEVQDFHTYYVGEQGILVHNACTKELHMTRQEAVKYGKEYLGEGFTKTGEGMYRSADGLRTMHFDLTHHMYNGVPSPVHINLYGWKVPVAAGVRNKLLSNIHIFFL